MKKGMKGILLCIAMIMAVMLAMMPAKTVHAATSGTWGTATYELDNDNNLVFTRSGTITKDWPSTLTKANVTSISCNPGVRITLPSSSSMMFYQCSSLVSIDATGFNASNVNFMLYMFAGCASLKSVDLSSWNMNNVTNIRSMFQNSSSLETIKFPNFNTRNLTMLDTVFDGCSSLKSIDLSNWNTTNVTDIDYMFRGCSSLEILDLSNFDTSNVTSMEGVFQGCSKLSELDISGFNTSKVRGMANFFNGCSNLKKVKLSPAMTKWINLSYLPNPSGSLYTGKWIREDKFYGPYTAAQLYSSYPSRASAMAGTWIWELKPTDYTLVFRGGDGVAGAMPNITANALLDFTIPVNQFRKFGYDFDHWDDGNGKTYANEGTISANTYSPSRRVTLTAVWKPRDTSVNMKDGSFEFSIKAGEKATFNDIPAGTSYQVYEKTESGWVLVQQENASGVIEALEESAAAFWNKYQPGVVTVQFTGTKKLDGHPAKEGTYQFELLDENRNVIQTKSVLDGGFIQFDAIEFTKKDVGEHTYIIREIDPQDDSIDYDAHEETVTVLVKEKERDTSLDVYSHTENINDAGEKQGDYVSSKYYTDVITISGAKKLHVTVKYTNPRGQFYVWQGAHEEVRTQTYGADFNPGMALKQYNFINGKDQEYLTDEFDVEGDSLSVLYMSYAYSPSYGYYPDGPYSDMVNYGYYMTVSPGDADLSADVTYDEDGVAFDNTTRPGVLKITKNADVTETNKDDTFTFEITFDNENGMPISDNIYWYVEDQN